MSILFIILGGVVGGGLGWLLDKVLQRKQPVTTDKCETST
jgi:F0F1-type ATP synthase assembly protein I